MLRALFLLPVLTFLGVSGTMNYLFAQTLGSNDFERYCWIAVGLGAAGFAALGLDMMRQGWNRGSAAKAIAAFVLWLPAIGYDAMSAYGFMNREHVASVQRQAEAARPRAEAEAAVRRVRDDLQPYADAPELGAAQDVVAALEQQTTDVRCRVPRLADRERDDCAALTAARVALTRARAKARLTSALASAEAARDRTKPPPPTDARFETFGDIAIWLPVIVLQLGSLLGIFAAAIPRAPEKPAPAAPPVPATRPAAPIPPPVRAPVLRVPAVRPAPAPIPSAPATVVQFVSMLARGERACPAGVVVDGHGWVRGPQRKLAAAAGLPLSRFNQELKAAVRAGELTADMRDGTAVRLPN